MQAQEFQVEYNVEEYAKELPKRKFLLYFHPDRFNLSAPERASENQEKLGRVFAVLDALRSSENQD